MLLLIVFASLLAFSTLLFVYQNISQFSNLIMSFLEMETMLSRVLYLWILVFGCDGTFGPFVLTLPLNVTSTSLMSLLTTSDVEFISWIPAGLRWDWSGQGSESSWALTLAINLHLHVRQHRYLDGETPVSLLLHSTCAVSVDCQSFNAVVTSP